MKHTQEIFHMIFISYNDSPEIMKPCKQAFNLPSSLVWPQLSSILRFCLLSITFVRSNQLNTTIVHQLFIKGIAVISFIPNYLIRSILGKTAVNSLLHKFYFMWGSTFHTSGDRKTRSVCDCHDLGAFATFCLADSKTPFFAGAKQPSMNASRMSILPRSDRSSTSSWSILWNVPCLTHSWKRLWQVWYGGYLWGKSFQGAPVLNIHNIPFRTSFGSLGLRPRGSFTGWSASIMGSIRFHCSFVSSILILLHNQGLMSSLF